MRCKRMAQYVRGIFASEIATSGKLPFHYIINKIKVYRVAFIGLKKCRFIRFFMFGKKILTFGQIDGKQLRKKRHYGNLALLVALAHYSEKRACTIVILYFQSRYLCPSHACTIKGSHNCSVPQIIIIIRQRSQKIAPDGILFIKKREHFLHFGTVYQIDRILCEKSWRKPLDRAGNP